MNESASAGVTHQLSQEEIVALLLELRDEFTDEQQWSVKRATWTMAVLAAQGKLTKGRKPTRQAGETVEE